MTTIGETLRQERLRRQIALEEVARELKISSRFLEAIEKEEFDRLPGGVFARSFARQYAGLLELHDEELNAQIQRIAEPEAKLPAVMATNAPPSPVALPHIDIKSWEGHKEPRFRMPSWAPAAALLLLATVGSSFVYTWWQRGRNAAAATASPITAADRVGTTPAPQQADATTPSAAPPAEQAVPAPGSTPADAVNSNAPVRVALTAEEPVWVSAREGGKTLFSGTLAANQTQTLEATEKLILRVGNAGGLTVTLNGKPVGALGAKGQPRTVQFTSGGFQIVAASSSPLSVLDPL